MLAVARQKNFYESLKQADLGKSVDFVEDQFDAVVTVGTSFQMPVESYREFTLITRPGGWIFYCGDFQQFDERGFAKWNIGSSSRMPGTDMPLLSPRES